MAISSDDNHKTSKFTQQIDILELLHEVILSQEAALEAGITALENVAQLKMNVDFIMEAAK